ncbi:hypothetical protein [Streptomyces sp. YIM 98790]|uniref:hypothetical protein n=1 Tax=Streptomyces sp. YIM 98790 TaxID=2689077 RepID=UPI0028BD40A3|nr:hypothetical protein [Streptomyces sp. YIM 98790]
MTAQTTPISRQQTGQDTQGRRRTAGSRAWSAGDAAAVAAAGLLFAVAAVVGHAINGDEKLHMRWPPLLAHYEPHLGPGTVAAPLVAVVVAVHGPALAARLPWRRLLLAGWAASLAWIIALALVNGWRTGVTSRLAKRSEYLTDVDEVTGLGVFLSTFTDRILLGSENNWTVHVAGHPPGALLTFAGLDRIGLGGATWAAWFVLLTGASLVPAVLVTVRALGRGREPERELWARRAAPFLVLAPAAVWLGVSADAYFAAVAAWALALLALAATGRVRVPWAAALGSGLLFGWLLYLSYGMVLMAVPALAVLLLAGNWRPLPWVLAGMLAVAALFTAGGFWWFDGYFTLYERYYQGAARERPYAYFIWANVAVQTLTLGLAGAAALRRAGAALVRERPGRPVWRVPGTWRKPRGVVLVLVAAAVAAALLADLSGMSKAETERIWLPFTVWMLLAAALLPRRSVRWWLAAQAAVAITVDHLFFTGW